MQSRHCCTKQEPDWWLNWLVSCCMLWSCETAGRHTHLHRSRLMLAGTCNTSQRPGTQSTAQRHSMMLLDKHPQGKLLKTNTRNDKTLTMKFYTSTKRTGSSSRLSFVLSVQPSCWSRQLCQKCLICIHILRWNSSVFSELVWCVLNYLNMIFKQSGILKFSPWLTVNWVAPGCKSA